MPPCAAPGAAEEGSSSVSSPVGKCPLHCCARARWGAAPAQAQSSCCHKMLAAELVFFLFFLWPGKQRQRDFWGCGWAVQMGSRQLFSLKGNGWIHHSKISVPPFPLTPAVWHGAAGEHTMLARYTNPPKNHFWAVPSQLSMSIQQSLSTLAGYASRKSACSLFVLFPLSSPFHQGCPEGKYSDHLYIAGKGGRSVEVSVNSGTAAVPSDIAAFPFKRREGGIKKKRGGGKCSNTIHLPRLLR